MKRDEFKQYYLNDSKKKIERKTFPDELKIIAEGDSWFSYPLKIDIIDHLRSMGYAVKELAKHGDTLENMIYGSEVERIRNNTIKNKGPRSLQKTLNAVRKYKPKIFLFSGGGNDIVGSEILNYLNHRTANKREPINKIVFEQKLRSMQASLEYYITAISKTHDHTQIIMDGYDYAQPSGTPYKLGGILKLSGPWILPSMGKKNITQLKAQKAIIKYLVDEFNSMLKKLDRKYSNFHHLDIRGMFPHNSSWHNEIHLNNKDFKIVATEYHKKISQLLGYNALVKHAKHIA